MDLEQTGWNDGQWIHFERDENQRHVLVRKLMDRRYITCWTGGPQNKTQMKVIDFGGVHKRRKFNQTSDVSFSQDVFRSTDKSGLLKTSHPLEEVLTWYNVYRVEMIKLVHLQDFLR
jgi:hypothetical protein